MLAADMTKNLVALNYFTIPKNSRRKKIIQKEIKKLNNCAADMTQNLVTLNSILLQQILCLLFTLCSSILDRACV